MITDIEATADLIMSARHSDAFDREACVKILKDNLSGGGEAFNKGQNALVAGSCSPDEAGSSSPAQSSQPKPESWQEIAREAAEGFLHLMGWFDHTTKNEKEELNQAFLYAIERSHAAQPKRSEPILLGKHIDIEFPSSDQPPSSAKATDDKQVNVNEVVMDLRVACGDPDNLHRRFFDILNPIFDARNAELAAEKKETARWVVEAHESAKALAAEREKFDKILDENEELRETADNLFKISRKHCVENQQLKSELADERQRAADSEMQLMNAISYSQKELTAERQRREQAEETANHNADIADSIARASKQTEDALRKKLFDERQRFEQREKTYRKVKDKWFLKWQNEYEQLLSALAAIEKHNAHVYQRTYKIENVDLSALHQHDNEVRKPLVDELQNIVNCDLAGMRKDFGNDTDRQFRIWAQNRARHALDALAKVKP